MFPAMQVDDESFVLRPMNCPHHMMIYANRLHSYKDLPIRIGEIAHDFRLRQVVHLKVSREADIFVRMMHIFLLHQSRLRMKYQA